MVGLYRGIGEMSGIRTNQDDFSQRSLRRVLLTLPPKHLSISPTSSGHRCTPPGFLHHSWAIPFPPACSPQPRSLLQRSPALFITCASHQIADPSQGTWGLLSALGINPNHSSSGWYIPHPTPPLPTPHLALYATNPSKLFQPYCRALTQVGHVH